MSGIRGQGLGVRGQGPGVRGWGSGVRGKENPIPFCPLPPILGVSYATTRSGASEDRVAGRKVGGGGGERQGGRGQVHGGGESGAGAAPAGTAGRLARCRYLWAERADHDGVGPG